MPPNPLPPQPLLVLVPVQNAVEELNRLSQPLKERIRQELTGFPLAIFHPAQIRLCTQALGQLLQWNPLIGPDLPDIAAHTVYLRL